MCTGESDLTFRRRRPRDLTYKEGRELKCHMEHDRMLFNGLDHQHSSLGADEQIDEFDFLCYGNELNWHTQADPNSSTMIGGLRSPCMNAHYYIDCIDRVGSVLRSFNGMFEYKREKKFFYLECNIRLINASDKFSFNPLRECKLTNLIANMCRLLDDFGKKRSLPRSSIYVNEDFWYMSGDKGVINNSVNIQDEATIWQCMSIFHARSPTTLKFNPTLSQTVHVLKQVLFRNCRESRLNFFQLCCSGIALCKSDDVTSYPCCECCYKQCNHYDDVFYISPEGRQYYKDMCPMCIFKVERKCNRFWNCCIQCMKTQKFFNSVVEAVSFEDGCFHFQYECAYVKLCMEGNVYENARRHVMRYFFYIDKAEWFMSQQFKQLSRISPSHSALLLNTACRTESNGAKCANCEMQDSLNRGSNYVSLYPKSNDDHQCKQVALRLNVCAINRLGTCRV